MARAVAALIAAASIVAGGAGARAAAPDWRALEPQNTLVIDTSKGRIVIVMAPELAPLAVARVKSLSRQGIYDGLLFHRVIDHFVDQTGNPDNHDGGVSTLPDLPAEFTATLPTQAVDAVAVRNGDGLQGFIGPNPVAAIPAQDGATVRTWGLYCAGVAGMGRQADPNSANSEIFFMRDASRRLDHDYTVWGRVVVGLDVVRAVAIGEPPATPDKMIRVRVLADLAPADRPRLEVENVAGGAFARDIAKARQARGADFTPCDVPVRTRPAT